MSTNKLSSQQIIDMIDLSAVKAEQSQAEFDLVLATAKQYQVKCVFVLPAHTEQMVKALQDEPAILVGGVVGFPSGGATTASKVFECQQLVAMGCDEIDMVLNIGWLKSGQFDQCQADIAAVVASAGAIPVKVILECHHLTEQEIIKASELAADAGVAFVKTGTGWAPTGATIENVSLMANAVKGRCEVKAAGGVRDLATLVALHEAGATRFGLGVATALDIINNTANAAAGEY